MKNILLVIDVQNDFVGGTLAVDGANKIINKINDVMDLGYFDEIIATQDWHPESHVSFASTHDVEPFSIYLEGGDKRKVWPDHCVSGTQGAKFPYSLDDDKFDMIFRKGTDKDVESYSGIRDENGNHIGLGSYLSNLFNWSNEKTCIYVCGIATDVCVHETVKDIVGMFDKNGSFINFAGAEIKLIEDLCVGVDKENTKKAIREMFNDGVRLTSSNIVKLEANCLTKE